MVTAVMLNGLVNEKLYMNYRKGYRDCIKMNRDKTQMQSTCYIHFIIAPMTTGYNIACALHPSLVSIPFYAIPISLSIIHRIFLFTSLLTFLLLSARMLTLLSY